MASTTTTAIGVRIPNAELAALRDQASRFGLTASSAVAALVAGALAVERDGHHHGDDHRPEVTKEDNE